MNRMIGSVDRARSVRERVAGGNGPEASLASSLHYTFQVVCHMQCGQFDEHEFLFISCRLTTSIENGRTNAGTPVAARITKPNAVRDIAGWLQSLWNEHFIKRNA